VVGERLEKGEKSLLIVSSTEIGFLTEGRERLPEPKCQSKGEKQRARCQGRLAKSWREGKKRKRKSAKTGGQKLKG